MTRKEEIHQAMKESVCETIYSSGYGFTPQATDLLECAFTKGAEWADKTMLDRACKWLKENMIGIGPSVHLVAPKTIARSEGKAKRVIDERNLHD